MKVSLTFLGTGTSTGIPVIGCGCGVCRSHDRRDKRLRSSVLIGCGGKNLLVDPGPDLRHQLLHAGSPAVDAVLVTHSHYDHVGGIDDLRPYCYKRGGALPVYCTADVAGDLRARVPYCFAEHLYPGVPTFDLRIVTPGKPFVVEGAVDVVPVALMHGPLPITAYRVGPLAYVTDCSSMPEESRSLLRGVDTLVVNALRLKPHMAHMSLEESLALVKDLGPRRAYLTHLSHDMPRHGKASAMLPPGVEIAVDGMRVEC